MVCRREGQAVHAVRPPLLPEFGRQTAQQLTTVETYSAGVGSVDRAAVAATATMLARCWLWTADRVSGTTRDSGVGIRRQHRILQERPVEWTRKLSICAKRCFTLGIRVNSCQTPRLGFSSGDRAVVLP